MGVDVKKKILKRKLNKVKTGLANKKNRPENGEAIQKLEKEIKEEDDSDINQEGDSTKVVAF